LEHLGPLQHQNPDRSPRENDVWHVLFDDTGNYKGGPLDMKGTFEVRKGSDGRFMFNLKAANHEVILTSQMYENKQSVQEGIASVRENAVLSDHFEELVGTDGRPYFVLHAANKRVIGRSDMYSSAEAMRKGIHSVKTHAPDAEINDLSMEAHG
jgi:uncharacterized protein YegP (UPF0339 family)